MMGGRSESKLPNTVRTSLTTRTSVRCRYQLEVQASTALTDGAALRLFMQIVASEREYQ
jgi:hypothetical protein